MIPMPEWQPGVKQRRGPDIPASVLEYGPDYRATVYQNEPNPYWRVDINGVSLADFYSTQSEAQSESEKIIRNRIILQLQKSLEFVRQYSPVSDSLAERLRIHGLTGPKHGLSREMGNLLLEASAALLLLGQPVAAQTQEPQN